MYQFFEVYIKAQEILNFLFFFMRLLDYKTVTAVSLLSLFLFLFIYLIYCYVCIGSIHWLMLGDWSSINDIVSKLLHFFLLVFLICGVGISLIMFLGKYGGMNLLHEVFQGNAAFICLASSLNYFFFKQESHTSFHY